MNTARRRLAVHLHPRAERAVNRGHPWVYADGIRRIRGGGRPGDLAVLFDRNDRFLAIGLYDPDSPIRIRVLHHGEPQTIDGEWLLARMRAALDRRRAVAESATTAFRVVHGENDGLPGLVVDRYEASLVVKLYTGAWMAHLPDIVSCLIRLMRPERVVLRLSRSVQTDVADAEVNDGQTVLGDAPLEPVLFRENGLRFEADLRHGQKTGFFLDQRDNRSLVEGMAAGKSVLDAFCCTGGFAVYACRGGARSATLLDASGPALAAAERNLARNRSSGAIRAANHRSLEGNAFELLPALRDRGERFDIVVLDPPAFAKTNSEVPRAMRSYAAILRSGIELVEPRGVLVAASCSTRITAHGFRRLVRDAGHAAGRSLRILRQTSHPPDHPIGFPEGAYLTCVFARVLP